MRARRPELGARDRAGAWTAIRQPLPPADAEHELSASIGIALGHADPEALLASADAAVYRAKAAGGGRVELSADPLTSDVIPDG